MLFLRISFWQLLVHRPHGRNRKELWTEAVISFYHYSGLWVYSVLLITFQTIIKQCDILHFQALLSLVEIFAEGQTLPCLSPKIRILFTHYMGNFTHIRFLDFVWRQCQTGTMSHSATFYWDFFMFINSKLIKR